MIRPDEHQLREAIAEVRSICDDLELGVLDRSKPDGKRWSLSAFDLYKRARVRSRDKLPAPERGRRSIGDHGDPTQTQAFARVEDNDEDLKLWHALLMDFEVARTYLRRLPKYLAQATPAQQHPDRPEFGCRVCSRPGKPEPIYRAERCEWCYRFWLLWKADVPEAILKLRREGKRITEQAIRVELDEQELVG